MADNKEFKLTQTKSSFTFKGIVDGLTKENAYREDDIKNGKNKGKQYRSIRFYVQTSPENKLPVEMFGMELDYVYPYKRGKKGEKGSVKKTEFSKRNKLPEGYTIIGVNLGLEKDDSGKNIRTSLVDFDAAEYIYDHLNDGDSVTVQGEVSFSTYENSQGESIEQTKYIIKAVYKEKDPINFNDEKFVETNAFEQEIVFIDSDVDKDEGAVYVDAYTILYGDKFKTARFVIRPGDNENIKKTANAFATKVKEYDFVKVYGVALNKAETTEVEIEVEEDKEDIFGGEKPKGLKGQAVTNYVTELRITGADYTTYEKGKYTEADFEPEEELVEEGSDGENPFGGNEIDDDDLPF